jgi:catechol 2,3-dioxygenase-like lactoylglutathione lyase family enzyme
MDLGAFSVSLSVKDIEASRDFYQKLGFEPIGGNADDNWLILRNGDHVIGLFQGMFEKNILTFNPGWDGPGRPTEGDFTDVREIAQRLEDAGIELSSRHLPGDGGPAHITLEDPDGNPILIDQHR